jgi:hypothetical protein
VPDPGDNAAMSRPSSLQPISPISLLRRAAPACRPAALAVALALLAACAPTLDWRDVDIGPQTKVQFPCKPEHARRSLPQDGGTMAAQMWSCEAGGLSWSATVLDVGDPARIADVLRASRAGLSSRLQASEVTALPVQVAGMTPSPEARRVVFGGSAGAAAPVRAEAVFVSRGLQVFQFVVLAQRGAPAQWADSADEFLRSVRWPR